MCRQDGDVVVVVLSGELDLAGTPCLSRAMSGIGGAPGTRVVLDLADLTFIDAQGIGAIERAIAVLGDRGVDVIAQDPQPAVRRMLALCELDAWLEPPRTAAVRARPRRQRRAGGAAAPVALGQDAGGS